MKLQFRGPHKLKYAPDTIIKYLPAAECGMRTNEGPLGPDCTSKTAPYGWPINESSQHFMFPILTLLFPESTHPSGHYCAPLSIQKDRIQPYENSQLTMFQILITSSITHVPVSHIQRTTQFLKTSTKLHEKEREHNRLTHFC